MYVYMCINTHMHIYISIYIYICAGVEMETPAANCSAPIAHCDVDCDYDPFDDDQGTAWAGRRKSASGGRNQRSELKRGHSGSITRDACER